MATTSKTVNKAQDVTVTEADPNAPAPDAQGVQPLVQPNAEKKGVAYVGQASKREITKDEWQQAGVKDQATVTWSKRNGKVVPLDNFTEEALDILDNDAGFVIQE